MNHPNARGGWRALAALLALAAIPLGNEVSAAAQLAALVLLLVSVLWAERRQLTSRTRPLSTS